MTVSTRSFTKFYYNFIAELLYDRQVVNIEIIQRRFYVAKKLDCDTISNLI